MHRESGGDYSNTFSKSRTLKDASQQSTASHTIPKVTGEVRIGHWTCCSRTHAVLSSLRICVQQSCQCFSRAAVAGRR
jgi:hypothetical protein